MPKAAAVAGKVSPFNWRRRYERGTGPLHHLRIQRVPDVRIPKWWSGPVPARSAAFFFRDKAEQGLFEIIEDMVPVDLVLQPGIF